MTNSWLDYFNEHYYNNLNPVNTVLKKGKITSPADRGVIDNLWQRGDGFKLIFEKLLSKKQNNFNIIETGTLRKDNNWWDGQSAKIFTDFVDKLQGSVKSVDINPKACQTAKRIISSKNFAVENSDSIVFLENIDKSNIDLFYLDSYDCEWHDDESSAKHHLNEFKVIEPYLKNCIVAIDDNTRLISDNSRTGKGRLIFYYLESKNIKPIYDNYQLIYEFTK